MNNVLNNHLPQILWTVVGLSVFFTLAYVMNAPSNKPYVPTAPQVCTHSEVWAHGSKIGQTNDCVTLEGITGNPDPNQFVDALRAMKDIRR